MINRQKNIIKWLPIKQTHLKVVIISQHKKKSTKDTTQYLKTIQISIKITKISERLLLLKWFRNLQISHAENRLKKISQQKNTFKNSTKMTMPFCGKLYMKQFINALFLVTASKDLIIHCLQKSFSVWMTLAT